MKTLVIQFFFVPFFLVESVFNGIANSSVYGQRNAHFITQYSHTTSLGLGYVYCQVQCISYTSDVQACAFMPGVICANVHSGGLGVG